MKRTRWLIRLQGVRPTAGILAAEIGISRAALSNLLHGRDTKAGKTARRLFREWLKKEGFVQPPKPPFCRHCGILYPTKKDGPIEFTPIPPDKVRSTQNDGH